MFRLTHLVGFGSQGLPVYGIEYSGDNTNNDLATDLAAATAWDGVGPIEAHFHVLSGARLGATSTGTPGHTISLPTGSICHGINDGKIYGKGGNGAAASNGSGSSAGHAIQTDVPTFIDNANGTVGGGGGGGGSGDSGSCSQGGESACSCTTPGGGGGGGAGYTNSSGGSGNLSGSGGSDESGGSGGTGQVATCGCCAADPGDGGRGGGLGSAGNSGTGGSGPGSGGGGGGAGKACNLTGSGSCTITGGTVSGAIS